MTTYLLDSSVLIAATDDSHEHHQRCRVWLANGAPVAICPVSEGALVRYYVRLHRGVSDAQQILARWRERHDCEFWPDDVSYADADLGGVLGHRQVTDAYLVALAAARPDAVLATLDEALAAQAGDAVLLVPAG